MIPNYVYTMYVCMYVYIYNYNNIYYLHGILTAVISLQLWISHDLCFEGGGMNGM